MVLEAEVGGFCRTFAVRAVSGEPLTAWPPDTGKGEAAADLNGVLPDFDEDVKSGMSAVLAGTGGWFWKPEEAGNAGLGVLGCLDS